MAIEIRDNVNIESFYQEFSEPEGYGAFDEDQNDYSKKENQIGCGYCANEEGCTIKDPKINKAKQGCKYWKHFEDTN